MSLLTLSEGKGSASFDAGPLFVDGGCCGEGCAARSLLERQPNMAATRTNGTTGLGARLLRLGRRRTILQRGCSAWDEGVFCLKSTLDALPAVFDDDGVTGGIVQATAMEVEDLTWSGGRFADSFDGGGASFGVILLDVEEVLPTIGALIGFLAAKWHVEGASLLGRASQSFKILFAETKFQRRIGDR